MWGAGVVIPLMEEAAATLQGAGDTGRGINQGHDLAVIVTVGS